MCCSIKIEKPYQISDVINELVRPWENPISNCSGFQVGTQIHKQVKQRFHESCIKQTKKRQTTLQDFPTQCVVQSVRVSILKCV